MRASVVLIGSSTIGHVKISSIMTVSSCVSKCSYSFGQFLSRSLVGIATVRVNVISILLRHIMVLVRSFLSSFYHSYFGLKMILLPVFLLIFILFKKEVSVPAREGMSLFLLSHKHPLHQLVSKRGSHWCWYRKTFKASKSTQINSLKILSSTWDMSFQFDIRRKPLAVLIS